ncbi:hypothetical protein AQJ64_17935 [Streptomyces griseoruber]|uniref:Uncharacterized protein n=1 Tax=Streptomyces griseoruber TaxID=1943 RepID=A0A117RCA7_9ACTN|nr:hypothetical protein AQJ64_17935 [Streptomyces griseoruber]
MPGPCVGQRGGVQFLEFVAAERDCLRGLMFSRRRDGLVVLGIGTIHGFWAGSQARSIWAGVAALRTAQPRRGSRRLSASSAIRPGRAAPAALSCGPAAALM